MADDEQIDVFLCHASEDKADVVDPIASALGSGGIRFFLDSKDIGWGDSVTDRIGTALVKARFVIVVLSASFIGKYWPKKEMNAALAHEIKSGRTKMLPLLVGKTQAERERVWTTLG